jgi:hypothetical protein
MVDLTNDEGNRREMPSLIERAQWPRKRLGNDETIPITWLVLKRPSVAGFEAPNDTDADRVSLPDADYQARFMRRSNRSERGRWRVVWRSATRRSMAVG